MEHRLGLALVLVASGLLTVPAEAWRVCCRWEDWPAGILYNDPGRTFPAGPVIPVDVVASGGTTNLTDEEIWDTVAYVAGEFSRVSPLKLAMRARLPVDTPLTPAVGSIQVRASAALGFWTYGLTTQQEVNPYFDILVDPVTGIQRVYVTDIGFIPSAGVAFTTARPWGTVASCPALANVLDLPEVLLHEFGHAVGFDEMNSTVMGAGGTCVGRTPRRALAADDIASLRWLYRPRQPWHVQVGAA